MVGVLDQQLHQVLRELENLQSPYRILGDVVDYGVWVCDAEGRNIYVSQSLLDLVGHSFEAIEGRGWVSFLHPDDADETARLWSECVKSGKQWNREHRYRAQDGSYRDVLARGKPVRNRSGQIVMWVGLNLDISDYKATQSALLRSSKLSASLNEELQLQIAKGQEDRDHLDMALAASGIIGTWYGDLKQSMVYGDANFARMYGVDEIETARGKPLGHYFAFMHPEDLPGAEAAMAHMMAGSNEYSHEHRIVRPDGSLIWVIARGRLIRDENGIPIRFPGVSVDITERKRIESRETFLLGLEERLRQSAAPRDVMYAAAEHLGLYLRADRAGYAEIDESDEFFFVARDWCAPGMPTLAGRHRLDDFGPPLIAALKAGKTTRFDDALTEPLTAGDRATAAYAGASTRAAITVPLIRNCQFVVAFYVHQRNPRRWTSEEEMLCREVAGRTWSAVERAQAEQEALNSAAQFQMLAQAMANHVWTATPDGLLDWFNDRTIEYGGIDADKLAGTGWTQIVHADDMPGVAAQWEAALASGEQYQTEFRLRRYDGVFRWHLVRAVAIRDKDGRIIRWIGTNTDIEEQKTTAGALASLNATLEAQVNERTAELMAAEETLRQSQKMEAVGQLTGGLAHDFNNLLTGIMGSLEMLDARIAQGRTRDLDRYIRIALGAGKRAAALTHRLLAFARRQTLDPRTIDINQLTTEMDELIRRTVGPSITIEVVGAPGLWTTRVDPNQLENALLNLCINARDAMPDGGRITIETANRWIDQKTTKDPDLPIGEYVSLCVSDTGCGMPPDVVARAFDPFFTTKPLGEGTGLGLSMVYGFARQSGGQTRIYSEVGKGTQVCIYLPKFLGQERNDVALPEVTELHRAQDGQTVLIVDDEPSVRMLVCELLAELNYSALEAEDAQTGLTILDSPRRIDLLITDVGLPGGMNGRQLADAAMISRPDLKILFITGFAENAIIGSNRLNPGMHIVSKPFTLEALASRIKDILD
jgi:PAS domain S-box-containing protein